MKKENNPPLSIVNGDCEYYVEIPLLTEEEITQYKKERDDWIESDNRYYKKWRGELEPDKLYIRKEPNIYLISCECIDVYKGQQIPEGKKYMTFELKFGSRYKTLTKEEIDGYTEKICKAIEDKFDVKRRG